MDDDNHANRDVIGINRKKPLILTRQGCIKLGSGHASAGIYVQRVMGSILNAPALLFEVQPLLAG
jgi:hypothetical protein